MIPLYPPSRNGKYPWKSFSLCKFTTVTPFPLPTAANFTSALCVSAFDPDTASTPQKSDPRGQRGGSSSRLSDSVYNLLRLPQPEALAFRIMKKTTTHNCNFNVFFLRLIPTWVFWPLGSWKPAEMLRWDNGLSFSAFRTSTDERLAYAVKIGWWGNIRRGPACQSWVMGICAGLVGEQISTVGTLLTSAAYFSKSTPDTTPSWCWAVISLTTDSDWLRTASLAQRRGREKLTFLARIKEIQSWKRNLTHLLFTVEISHHKKTSTKNVRKVSKIKLTHCAEWLWSVQY